VDFVESPYEAANGSHAIAIMTEWELYRSVDWERIYKTMEKPAFVFDGRNILDHQRLFEIGFNVYPLGRPPLKHF
jgi:UDPglucose 6-dehydrogenase